MTSTRGRIAGVGAFVIAIVLQTSLFGRLRVATVAPDVIVLCVVLASLRFRAEAALVAAFLAGLAADTLAAGVVGLRAFTYTVVAFAALRTRHRADLGPLPAVVWVGSLSAVAEIVLLAVGAIFGVAPPAIGQAVQQVAVVAGLNLVIALLLVPLIARLLAPRPAR